MAFDGANAYHSQYTNVTGLATGTKTRKSENQNWLTSANYFDNKGRMIQGFAQNLYGETERTDLLYNFAGEVLKIENVKLPLAAFKIAVNISHSGGARVITCVKIVNDVLYLLSVYDKSEKDSLDEKELDVLIKMAEI